MDANMSSTGPLAGLPAACHALLDAKAKKGTTAFPSLHRFD
jgi:hypothetical protein